MFKLTLLLVLTMVVFTSSQDSDAFLDRKLKEDYGSRPPSGPGKLLKVHTRKSLALLGC